MSLFRKSWGAGCLCLSDIDILPSHSQFNSISPFCIWRLIFKARLRRLREDSPCWTNSNSVQKKRQECRNTGKKERRKAEAQEKSKKSIAGTLERKNAGTQEHGKNERNKNTNTGKRNARKKRMQEHRMKGKK